MYECAIEILNKISAAGFEAYIVGGYPRDKYLGIASTDIDICTSATPDDVFNLFCDVDMEHSSYGSVRLKYNEYCYEVTTFRRDKSIGDGNRYYDIEYVSSLREDLFRRDFIINTLCIDKDGNYVDYLDARVDLDNKIICTVKDASVSFKEDPLRMLRAIRFATVLDFELSENICLALDELKSDLSKLSKNRVDKELALILASNNYMAGIKYLKNFDLDKFFKIDLRNKLIN